MYELPPEQLQLRAKRYCAAAILTLSRVGKSEPGLAGDILTNNPGRRLHHS
jgi:hypothetical protein